MPDLDFVDGYLCGFYADYDWNPGGPWSDKTAAMNLARDRWIEGFRNGRAAARGV